ncbi:hypothetical protein CCYA_CCYA09G2515 [Cyanidiococcus yangmingshanensis]|nr:hypothetical protein CCYA_CCYA09G2515 [Cyanidiococcus yangmingshanensis]
MYVRRDGRVVRGWRSILAHPISATVKLVQWLYALAVAFWLSLFQPNWSARKRSGAGSSSGASGRSPGRQTPRSKPQATPRIRTMGDLRRSNPSPSCASGGCCG